MSLTSFVIQSWEGVYTMTQTAVKQTVTAALMSI